MWIIHWNTSSVKIIGRIKYISEKEKKIVLLLSACIFYHKIKKKEQLHNIRWLCLMFVKKYFNQGLGSLGTPCHDTHARSREGKKKGLTELSFGV